LKQTQIGRGKGESDLRSNSLREKETWINYHPHLPSVPSRPLCSCYFSLAAILQKSKSEYWKTASYSASLLSFQTLVFLILFFGSGSTRLLIVASPVLAFCTPAPAPPISPHSHPFTQQMWAQHLRCPRFELGPTDEKTNPTTI
jgi:hypothetical protein